MTTFMTSYWISCQLFYNKYSDLLPLYVSINFILHCKGVQRPTESKQNGPKKRSLYSHSKEKHKSTKNQNELQIRESLLKAKTLL